MHFQRRVAVHEAVQALRTEREGRHHLARHVGLAAVGDRAGSISVRMPSPIISVWMPRSCLCLSCITTASGNRPVADLQRRAVVDEFRHMLADGLLHRADGGQPDLEQRLI